MQYYFCISKHFLVKNLKIRTKEKWGGVGSEGPFGLTCHYDSERPLVNISKHPNTFTKKLLTYHRQYSFSDDNPMLKLVSSSTNMRDHD